MLNPTFIEDATKAYILSYNTAMQEVKNPTFAGQIATVVTMSYIQAFKPAESQIDPMTAIMMAMAQAGQMATQKEETDESEGGNDNE